MRNVRARTSPPHFKLCDGALIRDSGVFDFTRRIETRKRKMGEGAKRRRFLLCVIDHSCGLTLSIQPRCLCELGKGTSKERPTRILIVCWTGDVQCFSCWHLHNANSTFQSWMKARSSGFLRCTRASLHFHGCPAITSLRRPILLLVGHFLFLSIPRTYHEQMLDRSSFPRGRDPECLLHRMGNRFPFLPPHYRQLVWNRFVRLRHGRT